MKSVKFSMNYFTEIKITSLAELDVLRITKQEATDREPILSWCNGLIFNHVFAEKNPEESDQIIRFEYFYYAKSPKVESSSWNSYKVEVHDLTNVPLFEVITQKLQEKRN
jgi:hypothetical protein